MQEPSASLLQSINPLIKLVQQRQQLYFELLSFVKKNIESSSNDLDNVTIFNRFINQINNKNIIIKSREEQLVANFINAEHQIVITESITKEMLRFSSRLIEILQASMAKIRKSIFDDFGRVLLQFSRFKLMINKILKKEPLNLKGYCECIINFAQKKYIKQVTKIQKYLEKVELGQDTCLRDFYSKNASDHDPLLSEEKKSKQQKMPIRRIDFKLEIKQISPEKSHQKKQSIKKTIKPSTNQQIRASNLKKRQFQRKKKKQHQSSQKQKPNKQQTAKNMLKFYNLLELSKKQFLEDHIYEQIEHQKRKDQLFSKLVQRNKFINLQINKFIKDRASSYHLKKSDSSKHQAKFKIRKPSFSLQSSSGNQKHSDNQLIAILQSQLGKDVRPIKKLSKSTNRPQLQINVKKIFVVKRPINFQDDIIPQAQINQSYMPIATRYKDRINESLRLKKKSNPNPLENSILHDHFRYLI